MMNEAIPQRVTVSDGRLMISGVPGSFVQGAARPLMLEAEALQPVGGFALRESVLHDDRRLEGVARVVGDRLSRIGAPVTGELLALTIRALPEAAAGQRILLGIEAVGADGEAERLAATLWLPPAAFASLRQDLLQGQAGQLSLSATTNLWVADGERDSPPDRPVTWHLGVAADGAPAPARGLVETLSWRAAMPEAEAPREAEPAPTEEDPAETTAEVLARLTWSVRQMILVLVFLLIVIALK